MKFWYNRLLTLLGFDTNPLELDSETYETIEISVPPGTLRELRELRKISGDRSLEQLLQNSLRFYSWFNSKKKPGMEIIGRSADGEEEVFMQFEE